MRLFMLPGLGANWRLFQYQLSDLEAIQVPEWLEPEAEESLQDYSRRWVKELNPQPGDAVGGMSFGGQVALEMAQCFPFRCVLLIAANRRSAEISSTFRFQTRLLQGLPESVVRTSLKTIAIPKLKKEENLQDEQVKVLETMVDEMDFPFFRWSSRAAATWEHEFEPEKFSMPIHQLHGQGDSIIKLSDPSEAEVWSDAGHLLNFTHSQRVNEWIKLKLNA
ncbi:MAG: alpha/beta hydrolase [Pseudomonadota bacterium]